MKIRLPKTGEVNVRNGSPPYVAPKRLACNAIARHNRKWLHRRDWHVMQSLDITANVSRQKKHIFENGV